ncbi:uncharacterized protein A4U43_C03F6050 [Asparagus officinalis]|uniref:Uncharacterized protein n=1 Tax=Asparagus officinalis TaxID=4686 RepID=A0A5P1F8B4_ASPOF|nr:uncharacterized protein A4U43_C03F6050 [Asparagus officinalis]
MELPPSDPDGMDPNQAQPQAHHRAPFPARTRACHFDGNGNSHTIAFNLNSSSAHGPQFNWYHIELPKTSQKLSISAQTLISLLCPPLKLQDILSLASAGPFCGLVDGALIFRLKSSLTLRLAARVTENSVVSVSLGRVPRLGFVSMGRSLLSEIPRLEGTKGGGVEIGEELLESLLGMNFEGRRTGMRRCRGGRGKLVHVVDVHVDQVQDAVMKFEMELDSVELELDRGGSALKKQMLDDRKFAKMHLNLQRLLQVVAHGEQVFPRVKEKCAAKGWFVGEDIVAFEELISRLRRLKENLGFIVNRVTAV